VMLWACAISVSHITQTVLGPLVGKLSDVHGRVPIVRASMCLLSFGCLLQAISPSVFGLYVARIIIGAGSAVAGVLKASINDVCPLGLRTEINSQISMATLLGAVVGPVVGIAVGYQYGGNDLRLASLICLTLLALCLCASVYMMLETSNKAVMTGVCHSLQAW
ncbi:tetracycline resistance protein, TetA/multidrug resistance protein MdtG, partial [Kipferlia bialata]